MMWTHLLAALVGGAVMFACLWFAVWLADRRIRQRHGLHSEQDVQRALAGYEGRVMR